MSSSSSLSSFPSMSGVQGAPVQSSSFIRLSPTSFFKSHSTSSTPTLLATLMSTGAATKKDEVPVVSSPSPPNELISTPKSHHRRQALSRVQGQSAGAARKKLCYPEEGSNSRGAAAPLPMQRNVCFIPKFKNGPSPTMKKTASQPECQSACVYDNFSSTNVYATPPRHSLRRQQSASATMMPVGNGRYRSNTAFVRFTPPIGEDVSALYAGSKFSDSPSAKSLPLPPTAWLEELALHTSALNLKAAQAATADQMSGDESVKSLKNVAEEEEEDGVTSDDTGVVFDLDDGKCSSPSAASDSSLQVVTTEEEGSDAGEMTIHPKLAQMFGGQSKPEGIRLTPLQLIAAVAAS